MLRAVMDLRGGDHVGRQHQPHALAARLRDDAARVVELLGLDQALAERQAPRGQERIRHAAPHQDRLAAGEEGVEDLELAGDLGATDHGMKRLRGLVEEPRERLDLALEEEARDAGQEVRDPLGRSMRAVS